MDFGIIALVFAVIFVAELPDKTMVATVVLGTRFRGLYVWLGAAAAFFIHVLIAVTAGKALTLLPHWLLETIVAILFFAGAIIVLRGSFKDEENDEETALKNTSGSKQFGSVFATAFSVIFIGEWGDITQIATANYAAKYDNPLSVAIGATLGLWAIAALAVIFGAKILKRIPAKLLQRTIAAILLLFAIISITTALRG